MLVTDPETIRLAIENFQGGNQMFPVGRIAAGGGGINEPWCWHYLPDTVRMTSAAIEICDGLPSHVCANLSQYLQFGYCPWNGRVVRVGR